MLIPLDLGKFQICTCLKCERDAMSQVVAKQYYLGVCSIASHGMKVRKVGKDLERGVALEKIDGIDLSEVFVRPPGKDLKCKVAQAQRLNDVSPEVPMAVPVVPKPNICSSWAWESRPNMWMNTQGKSVLIEALSTPELVNAVLGIVKCNFSRITKRIAWTKTLVPPRRLLEYPEGSLEVGYVEAGHKLEEFEEEATERGLL